MSVPDKPKERLYICGQGVAEATALLLVQNELLSVLPLIMEDPVTVGRLQALGVHQRLVALSAYIIAEFERRVEVTGDLKAVLEEVGTSRLFREEV